MIFNTNFTVSVTSNKKYTCIFLLTHVKYACIFLGNWQILLIKVEYDFIIRSHF